MKIHVSSPAFCFADLSQNFEEFSKHFRYWEIVSEYHNDIKLYKTALRELKASYHLGLSVHAPFSDINAASLNKDVREFSQKKVMDTIKVCGELGIGVVTVHPGYYGPLSRFGPKEIPILNKEFARRLDKAAVEHGVNVGLENMPYDGTLDCATLAQMQAVLEGTGLAITLDIGHAHQQGVLDDFLALRDRIVNIHIHDNFGKKDEHLVLGTGNCDLEGYLNRLFPIPNKAYTGGVVIECNNLPEGIRSKAYLEALAKKLDI